MMFAKFRNEKKVINLAEKIYKNNRQIKYLRMEREFLMELQLNTKPILKLIIKNHILNQKLIRVY